MFTSFSRSRQSERSGLGLSAATELKAASATDDSRSQPPWTRGGCPTGITSIPRGGMGRRSGERAPSNPE